MPFDEQLAARLKRVMERRLANAGRLEETRMFGGFGYMLTGNLCLGIHKDTLIVRVGAETAEQLLREAHVRPMDLTGKAMKGWAMVEPEAMEDDAALERFCALAIRFTSTLPPKAKF